AAKLPPGPLPGAAKVTAARLTGLPEASVTRTWSGVAKAVPTRALWGVPATATTWAALAAVLVRLKSAAVLSPLTAAVTVKVPAAGLAGGGPARARPRAGGRGAAGEAAGKRP